MGRGFIVFGLLQASVPPSNLPFLFAAFAVTWVAFFAYAFFLSKQRQEMQREVTDMQQALEQAEKPNNSG